MSGRNPDLFGALPRVSCQTSGSSSNNLNLYDTKNVLQQKTAVNSPMQLAKRPGVNLEKIEDQKGIRADRRQANSPNDVEEYILRGKELDLID